MNEMMDKETKNFVRYSLYVVCLGILFVGVTNVYNYEKDIPCDFSDEYNFVFELGMRIEQEQNNILDIILLPKGDFIHSFEYMDEEIVMCDLNGNAWFGKVRVPIYVEVYVNKDTGEKSEDLYKLYK